MATAWACGGILRAAMFEGAGHSVFVFPQRLFPVSDHRSEDVICGITGRGSDGLQATSWSKRLFICPFPPTLPLPQVTVTI